MFDFQQPLSIAYPKPSLFKRFYGFLVDLFCIIVISWSIASFPYAKVSDWYHGDEYLLQGTGVVSSEHDVHLSDRTFGGDCDTRRIGKPDHLKRCYPRRFRRG